MLETDAGMGVVFVGYYLMDNSYLYAYDDVKYFSKCVKNKIFIIVNGNIVN